MPVMRIFRMTMASLYLMASLFVVFVPHAAHAMAAPTVASADNGCHDRASSKTASSDQAAHNPCGKTAPKKHDGACAAGSICSDKQTGTTVFSAPLSVVSSSVDVLPTPSSLRSGLDPSPDLRPPRLSV